MKRAILIIICLLTFLLTGCWDQDYLVNKTLINGVSFDLTEDNKIKAIARTLNIKSTGGGQFEIHDETVQTVGPYTAGIGIVINDKLPGQLDVSKSHIILLGEDLAKKGILPFIELFYRPKNAYISTRIVLAKGKAADIISLQPNKSPIALSILKGLQAAETSSFIPKETVFAAWTHVVDPGEDIVLPYLEKVEEKAEIMGVELFNGDKYTGYNLKKEYSNLLLLLMNKLAKESDLGFLLDQNESSVHIKVSNIKRKLNLKINKKTHKIKCDINLKMDVTVINYTDNNSKKINVNSLNNKFSKILTNKAKEVTDTLIQANCDALAIGRKLSSEHHKFWETLDWEKEYKNVQFDPKVEVNIIKTGPVF